MADPQQSKGRRENAAQPLGRRSGLVDETKTDRSGEKARRSAGPDGPDARAVTGKPPPR